MRPTRITEADRKRNAEQAEHAEWTKEDSENIGTIFRFIYRVVVYCSFWVWPMIFFTQFNWNIFITLFLIVGSAYGLLAATSMLSDSLEGNRSVFALILRWGINVFVLGGPFLLVGGIVMAVLPDFVGITEGIQYYFYPAISGAIAAALTRRYLLRSSLSYGLIRFR